MSSLNPVGLGISYFAPKTGEKPVGAVDDNELIASGTRPVPHPREGDDTISSVRTHLVRQLLTWILQWNTNDHFLIPRNNTVDVEYM